MTRQKPLPSLTTLLAAFIFSLFTFAHAAEDAAASNDEEQILAHIHRIFQAFVDRDRDTIEATHSEDWKGFQVSATELTRGREAYMSRVGFGNPMQRYEIEDVEIDVHGDVAIVYYVAHWWSYITALDEYLKQRARSVDIYEKRDGHWIQTGSNISLVPRPTANRSDGYTEVFDVEFAGELPAAE